jgi:hypothetical protein
VNTLFKLALLSLISAPVTVLAHHSFATHYDASRSMEIEGAVVSFSFRSPHSFLYVDAENDSGETVRWEIEMASVPILARQGFSKDTFSPGDRVTVNVWPNRVAGNSLVWSLGVITEDGTALGEFPPTPPVQSAYLADTGVAKLQGRWRAPVIYVQSTESPLNLTPAALQAVRSYDPQKSPANFCEPNNVPAVYYSPYQFEIRIGAGNAVIHHEMYDVTRTVPLNAAPVNAESTGVFGKVTGRVEGDELVVESIGYPASAWGLGTASDVLGVSTDIPSSAQKKLVEGFFVSEDGQTLTVRYRLEDPIYLASPYEGVAELQRVADDEPMYPYVCERDSAERFSRDL